VGSPLSIKIKPSGRISPGGVKKKRKRISHHSGGNKSPGRGEKWGGGGGGAVCGCGVVGEEGCKVEGTCFSGGEEKGGTLHFPTGGGFPLFSPLR